MRGKREETEAFPAGGRRELTEKLAGKGIRPGLTVMNQLLDALGHPERSLKIIHIAGTNGKGSVFAFLSSVLQEAGYRVGRYISPTIICYEERFQINGNFISQQRLDRYFAQIGKVITRFEESGMDIPTLFEVETAISFLYFKDEKTDFALIETGMGGRLDATNVVKEPILTVIASVSYDHKSFLGNTLGEIARQKSGIIKKNIPVIVSENPPEVTEIIRKEAKDNHSPCMEVSRDDYVVVEEKYDGSSFLWRGEVYEMNLPGRHQISNAVTALMAGEYLLGRDSDDAMKNGLKKTVWPGRLEIIRRRPLTYLDGAHNPDGAVKLAQFLQKHFTNRRILYIIGVLKDKEYKKMLEVSLPVCEKAFVFRPDNPRGLHVEKLACCIRSFGKEAEICENVNQACKRALSQAAEEDILVVWGSLSFIEDMR